jgi:hypothetical protein
LAGAAEDVDIAMITTAKRNNLHIMVLLLLGGLCLQLKKSVKVTPLAGLCQF